MIKERKKKKKKKQRKQFAWRVREGKKMDSLPIKFEKKNQKEKKQKSLKLSTIIYILLRLCVYNIKWLMIEVLHENINTLRFVIVLVIVNVTPFKVSPSNAHKSCQLINNSNIFCSFSFSFSIIQKGKTEYITRHTAYNPILINSQ